MRNVMKRIGLLATTAVISTVCFTGCGQSDAFPTSTGTNSSDSINELRVVEDMAGNEVTVPDHIERYAVAWAGLTDILLMFDGTEHLVAYPEKSASFKWIFEVYPEFNDKICLSNEGISVETILESEAQVVFLKASDDEVLYEQLNKCGIAAIDCQFDTYEELETVVNKIAEVLGTNEALSIADSYNKYLEDSVNAVKTVSDGLKDDEKPSALIMKNNSDYSAYGVSRYPGCWIEMCGANYAMVNEDTYANVNLTKEQLFEYDPDFIFFAMPNQAKAFIKDDTWTNLTAVKNGNVYNIPGGFNTWSNCGAESALIFKWAAKLMLGESVEFNSDEEIKTFYSQFYGYEPSDTEVERIKNSSF